MSVITSPTRNVGMNVCPAMFRFSNYFTSYTSITSLYFFSFSFLGFNTKVKIKASDRHRVSSDFDFG